MSGRSRVAMVQATPTLADTKEMPSLKTCFALLVSLAAVSIASAAAPSGFDPKTGGKLPDPCTTRPSGPAKQVGIGMHVLRLNNMNIPNNQFSLDLWIWFRWADDNIKPYETFELINGKIDSCQIERVDKFDGVNYACLRVSATMSCFWDVSRFPLSRQKLTVEIEDKDMESHELVYVPDRDSCGVDSTFRAGGWQREGFMADAFTHVYTTNYGDPRHKGEANTRFSRATFTLQLARSGLLHSLKTFAGVFLATLVAFTVFFVKPDYRLGLIVAAVFALVSSHVASAMYLPDASVLTLADKLHLVAGVLVVIVMIEAALALHLMHKGREADFKRLDKLTFWTAAPLFFVVSVLLLVG